MKGKKQEENSSASQTTEKKTTSVIVMVLTGFHSDSHACKSENINVTHCMNNTLHN